MAETQGMQRCLSIRQIKCNNEKIPPCLGASFSPNYIWDTSCCAFLLCSSLPFVHAGVVCHTCSISLLQMCPALCMWTLEHHRTIAESQRQEYYCCLSRKEEDLSSTNKTIQILLRQMRKTHTVLRSVV